MKKELISLSQYYQPVPFKEYRDIEAWRKDCAGRYRTIKKNYGDFEGKTLIEIACANGYFGFSFLIDKGKRAVGVEVDKKQVEFVNLLAERKGLNFKCSEPPVPAGKFDIGLYLDTHYAPGTEDYPKYMRDNVKVCFTSCAHYEGRPGWNDANEKYEKVLKGLFDNVTPLGKGFMGRIIYKCE